MTAKKGFEKVTAYCPFCKKTHRLEKFTYRDTEKNGDTTYSVEKRGYYCPFEDNYFSERSYSSEKNDKDQSFHASRNGMIRTVLDMYSAA